MIFKCLLLSLALVQVASFRGAFFGTWKQTSHVKYYAKNMVDSMEIDGELTPVADNLLVKVKEAISRTESGLYIPDNAKEKPTEGMVVAVGPGRTHPDTSKLFDMSVQAGEFVLYGKYDGAELKYNGLSHQIIKDEDILLRFKGPEMSLDTVFPVKDQVLIRLTPKEKTSSSGIVVTTTANADKRSSTGVVVKVGPGRQNSHGEYLPLPVQEGENVRFREYGGEQVKIQGIEYLILRASDILAKWKTSR
mmetsp:Transcript_31385/g.23316  ORF Transcript_31385/g.23316 Transcript_31385/m.23316 type:complete len:249 (-) Transcript_31385:23-769(-)|eukprot:CAMPEP_0202971180 /NCGR_PEP_ID=MMETSP1396-20130829/24813_1 /ASSEMBLY_ACC=CAM_ASM_000872 /TAXON_ID= /ORGANISM="Pseudokeronopsis sp., Strain Brazil" /LENGTH=248 /DNA_ID=CAMNT_0049700309 /DNA_START=45 /DNA_END=791 /DNA_ORIENTATION=-